MSCFKLKSFLISIPCLWMLLLTMMKTYAEQWHFMNHKQLYIPGDYIIGGLFSLHITSTPRHSMIRDASMCHGTFDRRGYQALQGMLIAVRSINENTALLPGIKLGVDIKDTCGNVDVAVKESLNFSFARKYFKEPSKCPNYALEANKPQGKEKWNDSETIAIIGPDQSETARAIADLAGLFHVPIVSHAATSELLGDRVRFKHFFRTIPSDAYQIHVIIDLLTYFGWNYVILLASDDEYGRSGQQALRKQLKSSRLAICTVIDQLITSHTIPQITRALHAQKKARVIILFASQKDVIQIIQESYKQNLSGFTWIASDTWAGARMVTDGKERLLQGMLGIQPLSSHIPGFKEELLRIVINGTEHDAWADEFSAYEKQMCAGRNIAQCILDKDYDLSPYLASTINAVYAVAHALHAMLECSNTRCAKTKANKKSKELVDFLKNVKFRGVSGNIVSFDWFGSGSSSYQITNLQKTKNGYNYRTVANWHHIGTSDATNSSKSFVWKSDIIWNDGHIVPRSVCSSPCQKGQRKQPEKVDPKCCWTCVKCGGETFSNETNMYSCLQCPKDHKSNKEHTQCILVQDVHMRWDNNIVIVIISLASLGLISVLLTTIVFIKFRETPVVKAASRGLCCLLLFGVSILYLLPFTQIGKPTKMMCCSFPFIFGFCLSVNVGTMLVKTNRIARIFSKSIMRRNARFLSVNWQYLMITCIVFIEEAICLIWLLFLDPPHVQVGTNIDDLTRVLTCGYNQSLKGLTIWSSYNAGLILVCTYQAFLVRKVPHNYNEAKFIAFTMISICITILVYIPVHVGAVSYSKDVICSFLYVFVATVELTCIFGPKLYIILLRPNKNIAMQISESLSLHQNSRIGSGRTSTEMNRFTEWKTKRRRLNSSNDAGIDYKRRRFAIKNMKQKVLQRRFRGHGPRPSDEDNSTINGGPIGLKAEVTNRQEIEVENSNNDYGHNENNHEDKIDIELSKIHQIKLVSGHPACNAFQLDPDIQGRENKTEVIMSNNRRKKSRNLLPAYENDANLLSKSLPWQTGNQRSAFDGRKQSSSSMF